MQKYYLGIDQGTTGTAALLFDENWNLSSRGYREISQIYPNPGWVEHDPVEILDSTMAAVGEALAGASITPEEIACIGIDHEGESIVIWDEMTGMPVYNSIVWQDRRTARTADSITEDHGDEIFMITGLNPDAYFSATKLQWIIENIPEAKELLAAKRLLAGTVDTWLTWKLTGGKVFVTDASTASRTMLYDLAKGDWSPELIELFGLRGVKLPEIHDSFEVFGATDSSTFPSSGIPISAILVDQQAALLGQNCTANGSVKTTYGTGCFMLMNIGQSPVFPDNGLLNTVAWQEGGRKTYALDGGIYIGGAAIQWLRDGLRIIDDATETEQMAVKAGSNGGMYFVPAFTGLAAPHWDSYARGTIVGITAGITREHLVRATLESIAFQVYDVLEVMHSCSGFTFPMMRADGGVSRNNFLMQFQSDILNMPIEVPVIPETSALGVAYAAALGAGLIGSLDDVSEKWRLGRRFEPNISKDERAGLIREWHRAVERSKAWAIEAE